MSFNRIMNLFIYNLFYDLWKINWIKSTFAVLRVVQDAYNCSGNHPQKLEFYQVIIIDYGLFTLHLTALMLLN